MRPSQITCSSHLLTLLPLTHLPLTHLSRTQVRRYPRKFPASLIEADMAALLEGKPLPEESPAYLKAWEDAKREARKSE